MKPREKAELLKQASRLSDPFLVSWLSDPRPEKRWSSAQEIGFRRKYWPGDLIPLLKDQNPQVREAARGSLMRLASRPSNPNETALKPVDFGPGPHATPEEMESAVRKWTEFFQAVEQTSMMRR